MRRQRVEKSHIRAERKPATKKPLPAAHDNLKKTERQPACRERPTHVPYTLEEHLEL
jgi:hypothetical protein